MRLNYLSLKLHSRFYAYQPVYSSLKVGIITFILLISIIYSASASPAKRLHLNKIENRIDKVVNGQVTNANGESLNGVSIIVKGNTTGTSTDAGGLYRISVPNNGTLVYTFIGYERKEIAVRNQTTINVKLDSSAARLNDVVVTAFGISRERKGLVYSVSTVKGSEFTEARETNVANALTGKIAGVDAT